MSLPLTYNNPTDYFEDCLAFFQQYQHLYNFANTDVLVDKIFDEIKVENLEKIDVFGKDFDLHSLVNDEFLKDFFVVLERLSVKYDDFIGDVNLESKVDDVPLSPKKRHEIAYLVKEIANMCEESGCDTVVDFGSGLGYLDQLLFETTAFKVLGLECNEGHYVGAKKRQRKYHMASVDNVKYLKHMITENSHTNIQEYLNDKFANYNGFCIAGLHACADLTVDAINLFLKMADAKAMVLMPCCYHKMATLDSDHEKFKNFPLSNSLKKVFEKHKGHEFIRVPFLRLAAQPPCKSDDNLENLVFNLLARAALQIYAHRHNQKLQRKKRKAVKMKTMCNDFTSYIQDAAVVGFTLSRNTERSNGDSSEEKFTFDLEELHSIWREISTVTFKKAGMFILLQNLLQPVIENFVLYDRIVYLKENGTECRFKKIFNEKISPRCLCLFAWK